MSSAPKKTAPAAPLKSVAEKAPDVAALMQLLRIEGDARLVRTPAQLHALMVNEAADLLRAGQCFLVARGVRKNLELRAGSGISQLDRTVPFMQAVEAELARGLNKTDPGKLQDLTFWPDLTALNDVAPPAARVTYKSVLWVPMIGPRSQFLGALVLAREAPWGAPERALAQRLATTFAQAVFWQTSKGVPRPQWKMGWRAAGAVALAVVAVAAWPVSMTTLAPFEIIARAPAIVAAPIDGIIEDIPVEGSQAVKVGDELVRFVDTATKNKFEVAEQEVRVAEARERKLAIAAVADLKARHELAQAQAELTVKRAERDYARDILARSRVRAERDGIVVLGDKREFLGRPITTGERLMELADPATVEARISVPVSDAIVLGDNKKVKFFFDAAPLSARLGRVEAMDYHARPTGTGTVAYRVTASLVDGPDVPRLGNRGVAQLYGGTVPLIYYLFRRPFVALRQWTGL